MPGETPEQLVAVALGSNMGDGVLAVRAAFDRLRASRLLTGCTLSPLYLTEPVPVGPDGPDPGGRYTNAAMTARSSATPREMLDLLQRVERLGGRSRRASPHGAPRPIDLDLLLVGSGCIREPGLILPHPGMTNRAFVLAPLAELIPHVSVPGTGRTVSELLALLDPPVLAGVVRMHP